MKPVEDIIKAFHAARQITPESLIKDFTEAQMALIIEQKLDRIVSALQEYATAEQKNAFLRAVTALSPEAKPDHKLLVAIAYHYASGTADAWKKARTIYESLREVNPQNYLAITYLGLMHHTGRSVPQNIDIAAELYRDAIAIVSPRCQPGAIAKLYLSLISLRKNEMGANIKQQMEEIATLGFYGATSYLDMTTRVFEERVQLRERAAEAGLVDSLHELACLYATGGDVPNKIDLHKAEKLFKTAAEVGYDRSMMKLAEIYLYGQQGFPINRNDAISYYKKAAKTGNTQAMMALGSIYEQEKPSEAHKFYWEAATAGDYEALRKLVSMYEERKVISIVSHEGKKEAKKIVSELNALIHFLGRRGSDPVEELTFETNVAIKLMADSLLAGNWKFLPLARMQENKISIKSLLLALFADPSPTAAVLLQRSKLRNTANAAQHAFHEYEGSRSSSAVEELILDQSMVIPVLKVWMLTKTGYSLGLPKTISAFMTASSLTARADAFMMQQPRRVLCEFFNPAYNATITGGEEPTSNFEQAHQPGDNKASSPAQP